MLAAIRIEVGRQLGLTREQSLSEEWREHLLTYHQTPEQGGRRGREHSHLLLSTPIPIPGSTDPNRGRVSAGLPPTNREIPSLKRFWPLGWGNFRPFRSHHDDAWANIGFAWPWTTPKGYTGRINSCPRHLLRPLEARGVDAAALYVSKYLTKFVYGGYAKWKRRTSKSSTFGQNLLRRTLRRLRASHLLILAERPHLAVLHSAVPTRLLMVNLLRELRRHMDEPSWRSLVVSIRARQNIFLRFRNFVRNPEILSEQSTMSIGPTASESLGVSDGIFRQLVSEVAGVFREAVAGSPIPRGYVPGSSLGI